MIRFIITEDYIPDWKSVSVGEDLAGASLVGLEAALHKLVKNHRLQLPSSVSKYLIL